MSDSKIRNAHETLNIYSLLILAFTPTYLREFLHGHMDTCQHQIQLVQVLKPNIVVIQKLSTGGERNPWGHVYRFVVFS